MKSSAPEVFKKDEKRVSGKCGGMSFVLKLILGLFPVLQRRGAFLALFAGSIALAPLATGDTVTFTGGTATIANGPPVITDAQALYDNVVKYQEGDIVVTFLSPGEDWAGQSIGTYYGSGPFEGGNSDDVIHAHWNDISGIEIQRLDDVPFDLQFFHLTSNTENGGSQATGNETVVIQGWLNGIAVTEEFQLPSDDWGGSYQDVVLPASFDNVDKVVIRDISQWVNGEYVGGNPSAYCFGMDNFVFDDVVPQELLTGNTVELVVVDSTPPNAPTLTGLALTKSTTPTLTGTAEPGSTVEIYDGVNPLGSVQAESEVYSITVSSLLEGSHNITATATDEAGNVSAASLALTVVVDTTAPVITLLGSVSPTTAEAGFQYSDAGATADGQESVVTAGAVDTSILGDHLLNYTAQDLAGNVGTATRTVTV
ncbi:Ig-like domain-containing protein, partial [Akkermansiaceae bacterium]|nr:Ig-like domain-containing protein [Akkermansiaceae bacterium]